MISRESTGAREVVVWLARNVLEAATREADEKFPLESGGTFMGWWADAKTAVVTAMIGPGPDASHGQSHFQPDQAWQLDQIAQHYHASGRREIYLGDWHSHPNVLRNAQLDRSWGSSPRDQFFIGTVSHAIDAGHLGLPRRLEHQHLVRTSPPENGPLGSLVGA